MLVSIVFFDFLKTVDIHVTIGRIFSFVEKLNAKQITLECLTNLKFLATSFGHPV